MSPLIKDIYVTRERYLKENGFTAYSQINSGNCQNFAEELERRHPDSYSLGVEEFSNPDGTFDWGLLLQWNIPLPEGYTEKELDGLRLGGHIWLVNDERHYDAECPEGVDSFFELPFFQRKLVKHSIVGESVWN